MTGKIEKRSYDGVEIADGTGNQIVGYGAVFGERTTIAPGFDEVVLPGAFAKTLEDGPDVAALFNHQPDYVLGRKSAGTLELSEDERGLRYVVNAPDTQLIRDMVIEPMRRGDISSSSFAFVATDAPETVEADGTTLREIRAVELYDISVVTYPAYSGAPADLRAWHCFEGLTSEQITVLIKRGSQNQPALATRHRARRARIAALT